MKDVNQKEKIHSAKSVSFENQDGKTISLYAGAANFGLLLNLGLKVRKNVIYIRCSLFVTYIYILFRFQLVLLLLILSKVVTH